ncbi:hypothetical protein [Candidatus Kuenenia sp.]|uniref:hypothetical protein n=1 Tax=Candidatus Kuenenia sp. TaxID=2499824 RepID=UPI0032202E46
MLLNLMTLGCKPACLPVGRQAPAWNRVMFMHRSYENLKKIGNAPVETGLKPVSTTAIALRRKDLPLLCVKKDDNDFP